MSENMNSPKNAPEKKSFSRSKFARGGMAALLSVIFIAVVVVINVVVSALTTRFPSLDMDLTATKLNTLSEAALEVAAGVANDTEIILIGSEDAIRQDRVYSSYSLKYSQVANLAERMREANQKIKVSFVDPDTDPTFVSQYATDNLATGKVLVRTDKRYRVLTVDDMFQLQTNQTTGQQDSFSNVDGALANAVAAVNLDKVPVIAMAGGHGEMLTTEVMAQFNRLLTKENYEVKEVNFLTDELPENTQVIMLPTPTTDYSEEEITKLRSFLDDTSTTESLTLLVTCHPSQGEMPNLASFLEEWGVKTEQGAIWESDTSRFINSNPGYVLVDSMEDFPTDKTYNYLISPEGVPLTLLFTSNNDISTQALWTTTDKAFAVKTEEDVNNPQTEKLNAATHSMRYVQVEGGSYTRSLVVFGSSRLFTDTFMGTTTFGVQEYMTDLLQQLTGTDGSSVSIYSESVQTNTMDIIMSQTAVSVLGILFVFVLPIVLLVCGLVVFLRRRHL